MAQKDYGVYLDVRSYSSKEKSLGCLKGFLGSAVVFFRVSSKCSLLLKVG